MSKTPTVASLQAENARLKERIKELERWREQDHDWHNRQTDILCEAQRRAKELHEYIADKPLGKIVKASMW